MKVSEGKGQQKDLFEVLPQAMNALKKNIIEPFFGESKTNKYADAPPPLRAELFTEQQLEQHALSLATMHKLTEGKPVEQLLKRLAENEKIILEVHKVLTKSVKQNERIAPAGEWLLDNFYLIEEQIYTGKKHLPKGYSKGLPRLMRAESVGLPRVYDIAVEIISHSDGHVDLSSLLGFVKSYQKITPLKLGELWAIPIMLRLALLENLRRLSIQIAIDIDNKSLADHWATEMITASEQDPKSLVIIIADMAKSDPPMASSFVAEFTRKLQERGTALTLPLSWMEQHLSENGLTSIELIHQENQQQAADQVSISNSITSLRFLGTTDWREFIEETSIVERILRQDPDGTYETMDFYTRDNYRHAVEEISKYGELPEEEVAKLAIFLAKENIEKEPGRKMHVGYYLIDKGVEQTRKQAKVHYNLNETFRKAVNKSPLFFYLGGIFVLTALVSWGLIGMAHAEGLRNWRLVVLAFIAAIAASQLAMSFIEWLVTRLARPSLLPRLNFSKGVPDEYRSMVVIPTMLTSLANIDSLVSDLEVRFLSNRDANIYFALLTDFRDAPQETLYEDDVLINTLRTRIIELNKKYKRNSNDTFFLFHRPRKWNEVEKCWMGYERKRGKLGELNELLRGKGKDKFSEIVGDETVYTNVKYIITLDTDTDLPRDAAWKMIATLAHPLNHALYSEEKQRVTEGYTILQPRVSNSLPGKESSIYAKIHGNEPGTDPYTRAISDVYQDLFQEGSFIGKGIYDIDMFERALKDRFPDNRILSHDLLEGGYTRAGLISDVQLYEDYPADYKIDMQRRHRWIRGDWQIASWATPLVPDKNDKLVNNPISLLSKWKIFDNLRRSLIPVAFFLLLLYGWAFSSVAWFWTLAVIIIPVLSSLLNFTWEIFRKPDDIVFMQHFSFSFRSIRHHFIQSLIDIICLPYVAVANIDAIVNTLWRLFISHKKLLQWNPHSSGRPNKNVVQSYAVMWSAPVIAVAVFIYLSDNAPLSLMVALPVLGLWALAPAITWKISLPNKIKKDPVTPTQTIYLRKLARRIWGFFENFVTTEDNWLPPDNYQESPADKIAHRTSPTNIGLSLLANLTAFDFGFITVKQVADRVCNTINTLQRMERYRGHFYNWYDTISLAPLAPKYISTVDSGNFVGHLMTMREGLCAISDRPIVSDETFKGLSDSLGVLMETIPDNTSLRKFRQQLNITWPTVMQDIASAKKYIDELELSFSALIDSLNLDEKKDGYWWAQKTIEQIENVQEFILTSTPWLALPPAPHKLQHLLLNIPAVPTLNDLAGIERRLLNDITAAYSVQNTHEENEWLTLFRSLITEAGRRAKELVITLEYLATKCEEFAAIDYDFLYDRAQHLLTIGYNVDEHRKDNSFYDLLASEARLTTFVAIAQGKLPQESWFALGRQLTNSGTTPILLSWSGSMFEYLMPLLIMPSYENTLLDETNKGVIQKQIDYGKKRGVPWGISESGYNMLDANLNYQYKAFGVPGLGFKRGLGDDLVVSPYSTVMALMVDAPEAYDNLQVMRQAGFEGKYGFYEAVDYTAIRMQRRQNYSVIKSFMAHHQGMSFLSISYLLQHQPMQKLFQANAQVKSALLLLQERIPRVTTFYSPTVHTSDISVSAGSETPMRVINTPHTPIPEVQLLSNGRYHVMVTNTGGGYSRWKNMAVNRWREDFTCDDWGTYCYIKDVDNNVSWSAAYQPMLKQGDNYEAVFSQGRAEFRRRDMSLETHTEIVVSPEDDIELRRVHITNQSRKKRIIDVTSYAEIVLNTAAADEAHPAFSNLFVQTEINQPRHAILASRRARFAEEAVPWMFHLMNASNAEVLNVSYETDRSKFIGRGNNIHIPQAIAQENGLFGNEGSVLDPVMAIQYRIVIEPYETATIDMIFGMADTKEICNGLIEKYQDLHLTNRVLELAWTHSQVILRQINAIESDAQIYARLAGSIIFANASMRAEQSVIVKNNRKQPGLWSYSISGDLPIVLLQIEDSSNIELVKQMIQAHAYWRLKGLAVDLVIWNEDHGGYRQVLHNQILSLISAGITTNTNDPLGGIFIRSADQISNEDRILFQTVARIIISDKFGTLEEQLNRKLRVKPSISYFNPSKFHPSISTSVMLPNDLQFYNGIGGFSKDGKEYVIMTTPDKPTPAPWINILANPQFGTVISESGQSYSWTENAHELRLTPWNNDPISDLRGEAFYIRDEESGKFWSPSPLPTRGRMPYLTKHGFGYSSFEYSEDGIYSTMRVYTDIEAPVKFISIKIRNGSVRSRKLSITGYMEWVLGDLRNKSAMHTITEMHKDSGAILAYNAYNTEFDSRVAFFDVDDSNKTFTTDRTEFIGRNGTMNNPDAMNRVRLSGKTGAALDPCAALQSVFELAPEEEHELIFRLGAGKEMNEAIDIINKFKGTTAAHDALGNVKNYWNIALNAVQIETPDAATNILTNGWLNYQTLACRVWGRSGFYQSGGAFGFRDQLQDVLSLMHTKPAIVKEQILLCASRQFKEGDAQHWWHPPTGRGVRTTCSDDYLWLPFATARYIAATGDSSILDEEIDYLEGRLLNAGEESYYDLPIKSHITVSLYQHCVQAIEHGLKFGEHGLPFIGSGDWNDGMDKVGNHGKGESTWLAFFLYDILIRFAKVAQLKIDDAFAKRCKQQAALLRTNINEHAWDGEWYRRAYFDDGTPLGSKENEECKIDSIAQSWSVLSAAGDKEHTDMAMKSAGKFLIKKEDKIIQLFDPPFDKSTINPGYIKGYVPGVRENGGQYTHAAIWLIMAFAAQGDKEKTWELLKMINPVNHGIDNASINTYCVEPYVMAADVYAEPLHKGRGGWTWYTGSAGWMYQLILEWFIGLKREGNIIRFEPSFPAEWPSVKVNYCHNSTVYAIQIEQTQQENATAIKVFVDGVEQPDASFTLVDDAVQHSIRIEIGTTEKRIKELV